MSNKDQKMQLINKFYFVECHIVFKLYFMIE